MVCGVIRVNIMNDKMKDSGSAFPGLHTGTMQFLKGSLNVDKLELQGTYGMTLRDYFAAKAVQGMLSNEKFSTFSTEHIVKSSLAIADEMIKARSE